MSTLLVTAVLVAGAFAVWISQRIQQQRIRARMQKRLARTTEEFARDFFSPEKACIAAKIREILKRYVKVDVSRLIPDDSFVDIELAELDSLATVGFITDLEREFDITIPTRDTERLKTFRDVVEYVFKSTG